MPGYIRSILKKEIDPTFDVGWRGWTWALGLAIAFIGFEAVYFPPALGVSVDRIAGMDAAGQFILILYSATIVYLLVLFVLIAIVSRLPIRIICFSLFSAILFVEYSYQNGLGRFTNYYDIIAAISATRDQKLDSISAFGSWLPAVPALPLALAAFALPIERRRVGWKMLFGICAATMLFYVHVSWVKAGLFQGELPNTSVGVFCQTIADFAVQNPIQHLAPIQRQEVQKPIDSPKPSNNIILIFDESIRADHLSLNGYSRQTTPYLSELENKRLLLNWGTAAAASTSSHPSYDAFITGSQPDELEKMSIRELNSRPTIFQFAKAMGYRTALLDGQMMNYWGGAQDDLKYIDEFDPLSVIDRPERIEDWQSASNKISDESLRENGLKQWQIDEHIAELVRTIYTSSTGNFIFVYKRGCHFPYEKNFPPEETVWKPIYHFQQQYEIPPADKVDAIINSYDNSLRYNLDKFFKELGNDYSALPNNTVIIYTSDHGESFYVNGRAGHGGDSVGEAAVPLFILGLKDADVDTGFKASHHNIFAAMLDLMNYPQELRPYRYSVSILKARPADSNVRFFNPTPGKKVRFD